MRVLDDLLNGPEVTVSHSGQTLVGTITGVMKISGEYRARFVYTHPEFQVKATAWLPLWVIMEGIENGPD